nr:LysR family transcriptional regulator [Delftia acidovorans]
MIQISLRQLEYFVAAARHGSTARAAEAIGVSQPSISKAIADLEALWGEALFVRRHARGWISRRPARCAAARPRRCWTAHAACRGRARRRWRACCTWVF